MYSYIQWNIIQAQKRRKFAIYYYMMNHEDIMLSEKNQTQKNKYCIITL